MIGCTGSIFSPVEATAGRAGLGAEIRFTAEHAFVEVPSDVLVHAGVRIHDIHRLVHLGLLHPVDGVRVVDYGIKLRIRNRERIVENIVLVHLDVQQREAELYQCVKTKVCTMCTLKVKVHTVERNLNATQPEAETAHFSGNNQYPALNSAVQNKMASF